MFQGGFLGLDNIGPIDRSAALLAGASLEQSDGTAWMAMYALNMLEISLVLAEHGHAYEDLVTKFFEHFAYIAEAMSSTGLWDDADGFFYDAVRLLRDDPAWRDLVPFHEYFHGEDGRGRGASRQTGWTALVADLLLHRGVT